MDTLNVCAAIIAYTNVYRSHVFDQIVYYHPIEMQNKTKRVKSSIFGLFFKRAIIRSTETINLAGVHQHNHA